MNAPKQIAITVVVMAIVVFTSLPAVAEQISTCVQVTSTAKVATEELKKMVSVELSHFTNHREVEQSCETTLTVETFPFSDKQYITLRVSGEVPVRYAYANTDDLIHQLKKGLKLVLGNDPVYLKENISQYSDTQRALHSVQIKGHIRIRTEIFESLTRTGKGASSGPGMAFSVSKGTHQLFVFARLHASLSLPQHSENSVWRPVGAGLDAGFNYEFNDTRPAAGYIGAGLGIGFVRFEGTSDDRHQIVNELLVQCFLRAGVRLFRLTDFDMDLFVAAYLPFFPTSDVDTTLLDNDGRVYTPHLQAGIGVGF
ncbi:MAG: hypothetical protein JXX29_02605 [Deltaproteobacteria bacterium]|nr:hypothetical protein [Deltaproteobacteria bacterium]MBN2670532.1 hypothetical protein [Deltaproteobacteria bacterium]